MRAWRAVLFNAWFWLVGSVTLALLPTLIKGTLGGGEAAATLALGLFDVGVGLGAVIAARLATERRLLAPRPAGAALVDVALLDLWWTVRHAPPTPAETLRLLLAQPGRVHAVAAIMVVGLPRESVEARPETGGAVGWARTAARPRLSHPGRPASRP